MITTKRVEERIKSYITTEKFVCDFCAKETEIEDHFTKFGNWDKDAGYYGVDTIEIQRRVGNRWPNGEVSIETFKVDMCPSCWEDKFLTWLNENKVTPRLENEEY